MQDFEATVEVLDDRGAGLHEVAGVDIGDPVDVAEWWM